MARKEEVVRYLVLEVHEGCRVWSEVEAASEAEAKNRAYRAVMGDASKDNEHVLEIVPIVSSSKHSIYELATHFQDQLDDAVEKAFIAQNTDANGNWIYHKKKG